MKPKKATAVRIRPLKGDTEIAKTIAERTGLALIDVMTLALQAGLKAIEDNNYRFEVPIQLKVVPSSERKDYAPKPEHPHTPGSQETAGGSLAFSSETTPPYRTGRNKPK
jgi:hypothetical protein